jgi:hypothetical protein
MRSGDRPFISPQDYFHSLGADTLKLIDDREQSRTAYRERSLTTLAWS